MILSGTDVFLSEEDIDLQSPTDDELSEVYQAWLIAAASTDEEDQHFYSHGVFLVEPGYDHLIPEYAHLRHRSLPETAPQLHQSIFSEITIH
jgi:hypothetical protein